MCYKKTPEMIITLKFFIAFTLIVFVIDLFYQKIEYNATSIPQMIRDPAKKALFTLNIDESISKPLDFTPRLSSIKLMITITATQIANTNPIRSKNGIS